jgi:hypothetical protein
MDIQGTVPGVAVALTKIVSGRQTMALTQQALEARHSLFEAAFVSPLAYARCDVLNPVAADRWGLYEVKVSTSATCPDRVSPPPVQPATEKFSTASGLGASLLRSATFAFARSLSEQIGPLTTAAAVYLAGGSFCLLHRWWVKTPLSHLLRLPRCYLLGCGSLFIVYTACIYLAMGLVKSWK